MIYTGLRLALLAATWFLVQLVTPMRGLLAVAVALVVSGILGFFLLDRPRDDASVSVSRLFRRIDAKIESSRTAEDDDEPRSPQGQADPHQDAVDEGEQPGPLQDGDQVATDGPAGDVERGTNGQR